MTPHQESKMNAKLAPIVNMVYSISMIIEGMALDLNEKEIYDNAVLLRNKVGEIGLNTSTSFGDWTDYVEENIVIFGYKSELLPILCYKLYHYAKKMEDVYRMYEPRFDFYQMKEVKAIFDSVKDFKSNGVLFKKVTNTLELMRLS